MIRTDFPATGLLAMARRSRRPGRIWAGVAVVVLLAGCIAAVYLAGGPPNPLLHLLYIPVLVAAILFGSLGGLGAGLLAGAATGPWMTSVGLPALEGTPADWGIRFAMLTTVGVLVGAIQSLVRQRLAEEERLVATLSETHAKTLSTFASTIELRDRSTGGHSNRVARNARAVALGLELDEEAVRWAYWAGLLHDLGKVAVPERILLKPGPLTPEEMLVMRRHSGIGAQLLEGVSSEFQPIAEGVRTHHERWDGAGYPSGLSGGDIPLVGRALAVVDVFEALTCLRPYRGPLDPEEALDSVRSGGGSQFDPSIVEVFEQLFWRGEIFTAANPGPETLEDSIRIEARDVHGSVDVADLLAPDPLSHPAGR
jgi:hypothetical protein